MIAGAGERIERSVGSRELGRLQASKLAVLGAGLLGGVAIHHFGLLGVEMVVVDCGKVEPENLGNQGFRVDQIGDWKSEARARQVGELNPDCAVRALSRPVEALGLAELAGADLLLAELDGLESIDNFMCIGASNRIDLCDPAMVRQQRFGDRIYELPRPGREATRSILEIYLTPDLPLANGAADREEEDVEQVCAGLIDALTSYLHAPRGGAGTLATATLANSEQHEVTAAEVLSGALLASAVEKTKRVAAMRRVVEDDGAIALEDLLDAIDEALAAEVTKLKSPHAARRMLGFPHASATAASDATRRGW